VDIETFVAERFGGRCDVWHMVNCYCTEEQREQFNQWRSLSYQHADAVRDWINRVAMIHGEDIPEEIGLLIESLCDVPILLE
jgi:hypothetical protein